MRSLVAISLCLLLDVAAAQTVLRAQAPTSEGIATLAAAASEIERQTAGRIRLVVLPPDSIAVGGQVAQAIRAGTLDVGMATTRTLESFDPRFKVYATPFLFTNFGTVARLQASPPSQQMLKDFGSKTGVVPIGYVHQSFDVLFAKTPVVSPSDVKGKAFSTLPSADSFSSVLTSVGGTVRPTNPAEIGEAFSRGAVNAVAAPVQFLQSAQLNKESGVVSRTNHLYRGGVMLANQSRMESLSPADRVVVVIALERAARSMSSNAVNEYASVLRQAEQTKRLVNPTVQDFNAWRASAEPVWKATRESVGDAYFAAAVTAAGGTGGGGDPSQSC